MRSVSVLLLLAFFATAAPAQSAAAPEIDSIIAQENAFWTAYSAGDTAALGKLFTPDFTSVEEEIQSRQQVLDFVKSFFANCSLAPVKLVKPRVAFLSPDIATIVYHATESPKCGAQTMTGETNISTVWVRRDGRWQMQLHTEYAIPPK